MSTDEHTTLTDAPTPTEAPRAQAPQAAAPMRAAELSADLASSIDAAMETSLDAAPQGTMGGPAKPKLRGPRVVNAGREHRTGRVVSVGASDLFIEFGPKQLGVANIEQWPEGERPAPGDDLEVVIERYEATESLYICSRPGAVQKADWELLESGQIVEATVTGTNKGGLELEVAGHRAFMPASQVALERIEDLTPFIGQKIQCQVQKIERAGKGNIVLTRRDILKAERAKLAEVAKTKLTLGDTVTGTVRKIMPFGAFVDLGGVDGLIHITDLSHDRVGHGERNIARHVTEGAEVRVKILSLDWENDRIALGLKQLTDDPFQVAASEITEGATITGRVTKILEFGCFIELAPGVEGLVHISELDYRRVNKVEDVVKTDEIVQVLVLKIDPDSRKISLSIKQTKEAPAPRDGGGGGGRGRGGRGGERDGRTPEEILKETPQLRRMREKQQQEAKNKPKGAGGLGNAGGLGLGLGDLKF